MLDGNDIAEIVCALSEQFMNKDLAGETIHNGISDTSCATLKC